VRVVAVGAIPCGARVLDLCLRDLISFFRVAGNAYLLGAGLSQDNLAILGRLVARVARLRLERIVHESPHELR